MNVLKTTAALCLLAMSAAPAAKSQSYMFDNPENRAFFGVRAGIDISSAANGGAMFSNKPGFDVGAVYNIPVVANLYFEPGLHVFYNVFGTSTVQYFEQVWLDEAGDENSRMIPYQVDGTLRNLGFRIPLNIGYHFDFAPDLSVHVFTGPQLNLSLMARYHQNEVITPGGEKIKSQSVDAFGTNGYKHVDLQWNIGVGITYQRYYMSLGGSLGITRMKSASVIVTDRFRTDLSRNIRRNLFNISVGYNF